MKIAIINGPNINMLGIRERCHYGNNTWASIEKELMKSSKEIGSKLLFYQSNQEGEIVDFIQGRGKEMDGIIINPAAYTYSGYSIIDALEAAAKPFVEVHITNIFKRGGWHSKSVFSKYAVGTISGFMGYSYILGLYSIIHYLKEKKMDRLAVKSGVPVKTKAFHKWPYSNHRESEMINEVLSSGNWWRMTGSKVDVFETKFAAMHQVKYCLGVTNGTHALELVMTALGIGRGDEVIVPAITFISTATSVIYCNAVPILVDVDAETFCMVPEEFEKAITPRTKAVIPVHMAGHACDMDQICAIAKKHNIKVIEDAAHAHGGEYNHKKVGSIGDAAIFSFQNGKIMTCGEGGAFVTNDKELYQKAFLIHGVGRPKNDSVYEHTLLGSNYRMNEFQAAVLLAQLERLEDMNEKRNQNAKYLDQLVEDIEGITPQKNYDYATLKTHYMYMFYYERGAFCNLSRNEFVEYMKAEGIPAFISFPVISDTTFFAQNEFAQRIDCYDKEKEALLSNARRIADQVVWLPHYTLLGDRQDVEEISIAIRKIQECVNL